MQGLQSIETRERLQGSQHSQQWLSLITWENIKVSVRWNEERQGEG